jgi:hypothetical protein
LPSGQPHLRAGAAGASLDTDRAKPFGVRSRMIFTLAQPLKRVRFPYGADES